MLTWALARRLSGTGVTANAMHPGFVATEIFGKGGGLVSLGASLYSKLRGRRPEEGADTVVWLAASPERREPQRPVLDRPPGAPLPLPRRGRRGGPLGPLPGHDPARVKRGRRMAQGRCLEGPGEGLLNCREPCRPSSSSRWASSRWRCPRGPRRTSRRRSRRSREAAGSGPRSCACPRCTARPTSARRKTTPTSTSRRRCPGPSTEALGRAAKDSGRRGGRPRSSSGGRRASTTTARSILDADGEVVGPLPQDAHPRRPALLREVLLRPRGPRLPGLRRRSPAASAPSSAGTSGTRRARGSRRCAARPSSSTRPRSAGTRSEKAEHGASQRSAWQTIQRSHAIANGVYVAVVNRVGHEVPAEGGDGLEFWGTSFLADPFGVVIAEASTDREEILVGEVEPAAHRGGADALALPARPAHRRLRRHRPPVPRPGVEPLASPALDPDVQAFRMPAEWEQHEATWLGWPHNLSDWPGRFAPIPWVYGEIVRKLAEGEIVRILVPSKAHEDEGATGPRARRRRDRARRVLPLAHRPRLDARLRARSACAASSPSPRWRSRASASTAGPSTPTTRRTTRSPSARRRPSTCSCGRVVAQGPAGRARGRGAST